MAKNLELLNNQMIFMVEQLRDREYSNYLISQMAEKGMQTSRRTMCVLECTVSWR
jgi:hypothetical protein